MFNFFRRKKAREPLYEVQLHRAATNDPHVDIKIIGSWQPIQVRGQEAAQEMYQRLYRDNRWGGDDMFPYVTMKKVEDVS